MSAYQLCYSQEKNPLVDYSIKNMWGNPDLDQQFQIKLARISGKYGFVNDFAYLGKRRYLPSTLTFYHVFSIGGLDTGFWNLGSRNQSWYPVDTWVRASEYSNKRGVALDFYKANGSMFPREETYIMPCFDGVTLVAVPRNDNYPLPLDKNFYMHCYSTDINMNNIDPVNLPKYSFGYVGGIYIKNDDLERCKLNYNTWLSFNMGMVSFYHNGELKPIDSVNPIPGDLIEACYDPSIELVVSYDYDGMPDYYSDLDKKRKVILFPGFDERPRMYRYYDDCVFYVFNKNNKNGYYYNRNSEDAVRQLTHQDYGLASTYVEYLANRLISEDTTNNTTMKDIEITVAYHATRWQFKCGPSSSRINDLYLLEDHSAILRAMTGALSNVVEWRAQELEKSATNKVLNARFMKLDSELVREGLGYHGCSMAMSTTPLYMPTITPGQPGFNPIYETPPYTTGLGYTIPPTFIESSTAYEYSIDGLLLRLRYVEDQEYYQPGPDVAYVEWVLGKASTWIDWVVSQKDVLLRCGYGFRVYKAGWAIDPNWEPEDATKELMIAQTDSDGANPYPPNGKEVKILKEGETPKPVDPNLPEGGYVVGEWVDITDTDQYRIDHGHIVWNFDTVNNVGMVVFDTVHLYNEFDITHLDNSLTFALTHQWPVGGPIVTIEPGQVDIWMNSHPLIENVDYILDFPNVYIISKMWLVEGAQHIQYRATGLSKNGLVHTSELGFVADGVIGYNGRYNLRIDRPTKTIIGGRLYLTPTVDWAEDIHHGHNLNSLNGWPYEVKHIYSANKYVDWLNTYWGYDEAIDLDKRISGYLTEYATYKQPFSPILPYMEEDKYTLYSPFLSKIINELVLGFMTAPTPSGKEVPYPDQVVLDLIKPYEWMLNFDPIILDFDLRYFTVHPYNNWDKVTVTPDQLTFISVVNNLFLKGKIKIEGHFEVRHV